MKIAPILVAARATGHEPILVHTGQHYDPEMSDAFFTDLGITSPDFHLGVGSGTHAQQTARVMEGFEPVLLETRPAWLVVVGDVNSTLACALVASKIKHDIGCRIAHVEAGLRSDDWTMPEEVNRVLTDRLSDLLLIHSWDAKSNLLREGIPEERVEFVGNVMIDTLFAQLERARHSGLLDRLGVRRDEFVVTTLHRPSNVDSADALRCVLEGLGRVARELTVLFPMHPRTRARVEELGLGELLHPLRVLPPLGYLEMLALTDGAGVVLTDSGGIQEESTSLGVPCVTLREHTERPITVTHGTNRLAPWPLTPAIIEASFRDALARGRSPMGERRPEGWDGRAAHRIIESLTR